ncbi:YkvA family protein [Clostridium grantii]|uniref:Uncharacterized membrane protein YkvA, DUF1232 family n=1 Tax=Clostridium grantii DSM 8605 TaxID=1121316 RepID=A0A1M5UW66_9CLOT|nr:YkvA family protein [Clostridium grantii]SHH67222.1 Uncharacterized membrane protein YkvA, DUF1232 family [Clostridium grantii DSM 8605]
MNISNVSVKLTESDLLGILKEYVEDESLHFEKIVIDNSFNIKGWYKKKIKIGFKGAVAFAGAIDNVISLKILSAGVGIIPVFMPLINFILNKISNKTKNIGIYFEEGLLKVDFKKMGKIIPQVDFTIKKIFLFNNEMEVELEKIIYNEEKKVLTLDELKTQLLSGEVQDLSESEHKEKTFQEKNNDNKSDTYEVLRKEAKNRTPEKYKNIVKYALIIPDIVVLLYNLLKDKRVNIKTRCMIGGLIAYLAMPFDIIPDTIPILGQLDDVAIVFIMVEKILKDLDKNIVFDNWQGDGDIIAKVKEGSEFVLAFVSKEKILKIIKGIFSVSKKKRRR